MPRSKHRAGKRPDKRERERREAEQRQTENQPKALANKASEPSTPQIVDSTKQESPSKEQSERELTQEQREEMLANLTDQSTVTTYPVVLELQLESPRRQLNIRIFDICESLKKEWNERGSNGHKSQPIKTPHILEYIESQRTDLGAMKEGLLKDLLLWGEELVEEDGINGEPQYVDPEGMVEDFKSNIDDFRNRLKREMSGL